MAHVQPAPSLRDLLARTDPARLPSILGLVPSPEVDGAYLHWDEIRYRTAPGDLTREEWWLGLKIARSSMARVTPLVATDGAPFSYGLPDQVLEQLHWIDQNGANDVLAEGAVPDAGDRRRFLISSLMEESITSSQLEGANVTRKIASEMLRSGRAPRDRGERMILNNYRAMTRIRDLAQAPLTLEGVLELHAILTEGTLDDPSAAGRIQRPDEERVRVFDPDEKVVRVPPPAAELPERMREMIRFANGETPAGFLHPVLRAVLLHLWLAYDHPFEDGNGRTARAIFYWSMLRSGYWLFEYLSISRLLLKAPAQYGRAFTFTESDGSDATYFLLHQLRIIRRAVDELFAYLRKKMRETEETIRLLRKSSFNHRQAALLAHALRHRDFEYTVQSHATSHDVVEQSARTDLEQLRAAGLLERRTVGRKFFFYPAPDLRQRLDALSR